MLQKINFFKLVITATLLLFIQQVYAGFPIGRKRAMIAPTYNYYNASQYWDKTRQLNPFPGSGKFSSHYFGIYGGFGLSDKVDFVGNLPFVYQVASQPGVINSNGSLGDATMGLQYLLHDFDFYKYLTFTGSLILPLYPGDQTNTKPMPGYQEVGLEGKLGFSGSTRTRLYNHYWDANVGVRRYLSSSGPTQFFFDALYGIPVSDKVKITVSLSGVNSSSPDQGFAINPFINRHFSYLRITPGIGFKTSENAQIFLNVFSDISGKNVGKGSGGSITYVVKLGTDR